MKVFVALAGICAACTADPVDILDTDAEPAAALHIGAAASCPAPTLLPIPDVPGLPILGDAGSTAGTFDPSVVYPAGAPGGAMAYSSVPDQHSIRTRIALSGDGGRSWTYVAQPNAPELAIIASSDRTECPTGVCVGFLISEVSSLVYDPTDPAAAARWKLFAHRYLAEANDRLHYRIGTITLQTAPAPQGPWTAPQKLLGLPSPSAYTTSGTLVDASRLAGFADCIALTEPSALWRPDRIDLAVGCVYLSGATPRIRVARARTTDHGRTWVGLGTMLVPGDADCLPGATAGASVNAADLFLGPDGSEYVSATASDPGYHGCAVYKVAHPATGQIERWPSGAPRVYRTLAPTSGQFSGACTWSAGGGGYLMSVGFLGSPRPFRIFPAGAAAP